MPKTLEEAARELLRLKDLHDRIECNDFATWEGYTGAVDDYRTNKPRAWDDLRAALAQDRVSAGWQVRRINDEDGTGDWIPCHIDDVSLYQQSPDRWELREVFALTAAQEPADER